MTRDEMRAAARNLVADWPPLSTTQRALLAMLLRPHATTPSTAAVGRRAA